MPDEDMPDDALPDETIEDAIFRLDAVVTRAEDAFARYSTAAAPPVAPTDTAPDADPDLPARHAALRAATEDALARLDRLIATEQG